jgi:hypothetical protein
MVFYDFNGAVRVQLTLFQPVQWGQISTACSPQFKNLSTPLESDKDSSCSFIFELCLPPAMSIALLKNAMLAYGCQVHL